MEEVVSNQPLETLVVRDHLGVDLLMKLTSTRCLGPFMRNEHTLGSAAAELEMPASSLAYYVQRFQRAGLVHIISRQQRAGKPIPIYRATALRFQVPFDAMPPGTRNEFLQGSRNHMLAAFTAAMDREITRRHGGGIQVVSHPERGVIVDLIEDSPGATQTSDVAEWWGKVRLTEEEASEYAAALEALARRFSNDTPGPGRRTYITMSGIVPERRR